MLPSPINVVQISSQCDNAKFLDEDGRVGGAISSSCVANAAKGEALILVLGSMWSWLRW